MADRSAIVKYSRRDGGVRYGICAATPLLYGAIEIYRSHHFVIGGGGEELQPSKIRQKFTMVMAMVMILFLQKII